MVVAGTSVPSLIGGVGRRWRERTTEEGRRGRRTIREERERDEEGREKVDQVTQEPYILL